MANLNFQTRMTLFFSALFIVVQSLTLVTGYWLIRDFLSRQIGENLLYAENSFKRMLIEHGMRIAGEARILTADFGFRSAAASGDPDTLQSALENLIYRIRGQRGFYIGLDGVINADTLKNQRRGQGFMFPDALSRAETEAVTAFGLLDGQICEITIAPVLAPLTIGWVGVVMPINQPLIDGFLHFSSTPPDIALAIYQDNDLRILTGTFMYTASLSENPGLSAEALSQYQQPRLDSGGKAMILIRPLTAASAHQAVYTLISIELDYAMRRFNLLLLILLGLLLLALLAALIGGYALAVNLTQPLRKLAQISGRMLQGDAPPLPVERDDEIGRLAETFNRASRIAAEISELKEQDQLRRELVADVSHDLRSPLAALHGYLETMQLKANQYREDERDRFLAAAVSQSAKLGKLAEQLFALARLECQDMELHPEDFNIQELLQDIALKFELPARQKHLRLSQDYGQDLPLARADIGLIERLLTNLLDNAIRHSPLGGEIRIACELRQNRLWVSLADQGPGIAPEYLPKLFERDSPLSRQARAHSGGLGLLIAARIAALHDSRIQVVSSLGGGAEFTFDLPVAAA